MKNLFRISAVALCAAAVLAACTDDEGDSPRKLTVAPAGDVAFAACRPEPVAFEVNASSDWTVGFDTDGEAGWLRIERTASGFVLSAEPNGEPEPRPAVGITVSAAGCEPVRITVQQRGLEILACGYVFMEDPAGKESAVAAWWRNGRQTVLTDNSGSPAWETHANGIYAEGERVYIAGYRSVLYLTTGVYWLDGRMGELFTEFGEYGSLYLSDIRIKDGAVYLAGRDGVNGNTLAQYWVDGIPTALSDEGLVSDASDLFFDGETLYVSGRNGSTPGYWKDGAFVDLSFGGDFGTYIVDLEKVGDDLYAGGMYTDVDKYVPVCWTNGTARPVPVEESSNVYGMSVADDGTVYLAGSQGLGLERAAAYWKGDERVLLTGKVNGCLTRVVEVGGNVWAVGIEENAAGNTVVRCWKNGEPTDWTDGESSAYVQDVLIR